VPTSHARTLRAISAKEEKTVPLRLKLAAISVACLLNACVASLG
jgi:hypothetical protein